MSYDITSNLELLLAFQDGSGNGTLSDTSGHGRNGTAVTSGPNYATGKYGAKSILLNGSNAVQVTGLLGSPASVTVCAWANLTAHDSGGSELVSLGDAVTIRLDSSGNCLAQVHVSGTWNAASFGFIATNAGWTHFALKFRSSDKRLRLYIN